jgi:hypothetical protein
MVNPGGAAKSAVARLPKHGAQVLRLTSSCREGQRRERGTRRAGGALTGDGAAVKRSGDGGKAAAMKARGGDKLRRERGGKEGGLGCGKMRRGRGAFYRCRGGGWQPGNGEVKAAPLMAVCAGYRKSGRRRWPIKEG